MGVSFDPAKVKRRNQTELHGSAILSAFSQSTAEGVMEIALDRLDPWTTADGEGQPFRLYPADKLRDMAENIREHGVLNPCIVRPLNGRYQLLAGHNRTAAARLAGLETVPCIVKDVDDETAVLYMIDSNLFQREQILPSERAKAYAMKLEIYRRRGRRTDLTGESGVDAAQRVAEEVGDSARSVQRYARLTRLMPQLLELVDEGKIPVTAGSEVAALNADDQVNVFQAVAEEKKGRLSLAQAEEIRTAAAETDRLSVAAARRILRGAEEQPERKKLTLVIPAAELSPLESKRLKRLLKEDPALQQLLLETVLDYMRRDEREV